MSSDPRAVVSAESFRKRLDDPQISVGDVDAIVHQILDAIAATEMESSSDDRARRKCELIDLLGKAAERTDSAVLPLADALGDRDGYEDLDYDRRWEAVAMHARIALSGIGGRAVPVLTDMLDDLRRRDVAAELLWQLGSRARAAASALEQHAADPDFGATAGFTLGKVLEGDPSLTERVKRMLADPVRREAGAAASVSLPDSMLVSLVDRFVEMLTDTNAKVRGAAAGRLERLGQLGHSGDHAAAVLATCLDDPDPDVSLAALKALAHVALDDESVARSLLTRLVDRRTPKRYDVLLALSNRTSRVLTPLVPAFLAQFSDQTDTLHDEVALLLGALGPSANTSVVDALAARLRVLKGDDERSANLVIGALERIGPGASRSIPALEQASKHGAEQVREAATHALAAIRR